MTVNIIERTTMHISTENLLWTIGIIALVGVVIGVMNGFIGSLLAQITGG